MYKMIEPKLSNLTPLPGKLRYPNDSDKAKAYDALPTDQDRLNDDGKWWSMYQIMKHFHSGIVPEHNDSNYFDFEIDFTSSHLRVAGIDDPNMVSEVNSTMTNGLQSLSSKIQSLLAQIQVEAANKAMAASTAGILARPTGGRNKKKQRGGFDPMNPGAAAAAAPVTTAQQLTDLVAPINLEKECFRDLFRIKLNTWDRIFILSAKDGKLPLASALALVKPEDVADKVKAEIAAPPPPGEDMPIVGGRKHRKHRTRKAAKYGKKVKTHRRHRR